MDIATNAVLLAVLMQVSDVVKKLELPLATPLEATNVQVFRVAVYPGPEDSTTLSCYLDYSGHEFWHSHGRIGGFCTPASYLRDPGGRASRLFGEVHFSEAECLAKARGVIAKLGYTNVSLLDSPPKITPPIVWRGKTIPRYFFEWIRPLEEGEVQTFPSVTVEVNASRLAIEKLDLADTAFWREEWPVTFGQTNVSLLEMPAQPKRNELELEGVTKQYAMACIRAVLPEINAFCSKLGMLLPSPIREADIDMGESLVAMRTGRPMVHLVLKTGHQIVYYKGHVWGVQTRDTSFGKPWRLEGFRESEEYLGAIKLSKRDVTKIARKVLVEKLGLPVKPLYLDTEPVFHLVPNHTATKGARRYYFSWQPPETDDERVQRGAWGVNPELSVSVEVDAVSGEIKVLRFWHQSLERPDPKIDLSESNRN
jgi:hypothetical protein